MYYNLIRFTPMAVNLDKPINWKKDIIASVDMYNNWFMEFAPDAFRKARIETTKSVESALRATDYLRNISPVLLREHPEVLPTLRMATCPPLAVDRLIGLAGVSQSLVKSLELSKKIPPRASLAKIDGDLEKISRIIEKLADPDIFVWLENKSNPSEPEMHRAATIVADRLCGSVANPIIRNAQEKRQLNAIKEWLENRGYRQLSPKEGFKFDSMPAGTFSFRMNIPIKLDGGTKSINIPVDAVIMPRTSSSKLPILIEAKSAGDFTNTNKRRKEEAIKITQLKNTYGETVSFSLFLCGYFDSGYLGYEAAEGIDWIWEHRIDDLAFLGI